MTEYDLLLQPIDLSLLDGNPKTANRRSGTHLLTVVQVACTVF